MIDDARPEWVKCPICGEDDMRKEHGRIDCVNLSCGSNGGNNFSAIPQENFGNPDVGYLNGLRAVRDMVDTVLKRYPDK